MRTYSPQVVEHQGRPVFNGWGQDLGELVGEAMKGASGQVFATPQAQAAVAAITKASTEAAFKSARSEVARLLIPAVVAGVVVGWFVWGRKRGS